MPKKNMTPEERKAWGDKMQAARAEAAKRKETASTTLNPGMGEEPAQTISHADYNSLVQQIEELKKTLFSQAQAPAAPAYPQASVSGHGMVGTVEKYLVDPKYYPDPTQRLLDEPKLQQFAMRVNYDITFQVSTDQYETIDRVRMKEPRFTLELHRVVYDENGEPTKGRYVLNRLILHEDPQAAIVIARERGLEIEDYNEKQFLDEMRYLRCRDWLLETFFPPRSTARAQMRDMVVDGRQVQYFETNSDEQNSSLPFGGLNTKI